VMKRGWHLIEEGAKREGLRGTPGLNVVCCLTARRLHYHFFHDGCLHLVSVTFIHDATIFVLRDTLLILVKPVVYGLLGLSLRTLLYLPVLVSLIIDDGAPLAPSSLLRRGS
jgi:hypothetical protein